MGGFSWGWIPWCKVKSHLKQQIQECRGVRKHVTVFPFALQLSLELIAGKSTLEYSPQPLTVGVGHSQQMICFVFRGHEVTKYHVATPPKRAATWRKDLIEEESHLSNLPSFFSKVLKNDKCFFLWTVSKSFERKIFPVDLKGHLRPFVISACCSLDKSATGTDAIGCLLHGQSGTTWAAEQNVGLQRFLWKSWVKPGFSCLYTGDEW